MQVESAHQKSKYEKLNKAFTKKKTSKEETVILDISSDSDFSSSSESDNSPNETGEKDIACDLDYTDVDESGRSSISSNGTIYSTVAEIHLSLIY